MILATSSPPAMRYAGAMHAVAAYREKSDTYVNWALGEQGPLGPNDRPLRWVPVGSVEYLRAEQEHLERTRLPWWACEWLK